MEFTSISPDLIRGKVDAMILKCLDGGEKYGLEICDAIRDASGGTYVLKLPTLYSALNRLEKKKFLASYKSQGPSGSFRKYFKLTDLGRSTFIDKKDDVRFSNDVINTLLYDNITKNRFARPAEDNVRAEMFEKAQEQIDQATEKVEKVAKSKRAQADYLADATCFFDENSEDEESDTGALTSEITSKVGEYFELPLRIERDKTSESTDAQSQKAPITPEPDTEFSRYISPDEFVASANDFDATPNRFVAIGREVPKKPALRNEFKESAKESVTVRPHIHKSAIKPGAVFVLYNKLKAFCSLFVVLLCSVFLVLININFKSSYSQTQSIFFTIAFSVLGLYLLFNICVYLLFPKSKKMFANYRREFTTRAIITVSLVVLSLAIAIIFADIGAFTTTDYFIYLVVPGVVSLAVLLDGVAIFLLKKVKFFRAA